MEKNKILGIISNVVFVLGWLLYSKLGLVIALIIEIIALAIAVASAKKGKNIFATIGAFGSIALITMMIVILILILVSAKTGESAIINKANQVQQMN